LTMFVVLWDCFQRKTCDVTVTWQCLYATYSLNHPLPESLSPWITLSLNHSLPESLSPWITLASCELFSSNHSKEKMPARRCRPLGTELSTPCGRCHIDCGLGPRLNRPSFTVRSDERVCHASSAAGASSRFSKCSIDILLSYSFAFSGLASDSRVPLVRH